MFQQHIFYSSTQQAYELKTFMIFYYVIVYVIQTKLPYIERKYFIA